MDEIGALLYAPGAFRCDKCGFHLEKRVMLVATGEVGIRKDGDDAEPCPNDGQMLRRVTWRELYEDCAKYSSEIAHGLAESVKLQSHYAGLLNAYDGGERMQFDSFGAWLQRLSERKVVPCD